MEERKIGIMGGTFDPIHNAHIALAEFAFTHLSLTELCFMPAGNPYLDKHSDITEAALRARMVELAIESFPQFYLSRVELEREGHTYTVDTLRELKKRYPCARFYFIIGTDQLYQLEKWREPEEIFRMTDIAVAKRDRRFSDEEIEERVSYLREHYKARIHVLDCPIIELSSTELRRRLDEGRDVSHFIPKEVEAFIKEHRLYQR